MVNLFQISPELRELVFILFPPFFQLRRKVFSTALKLVKKDNPEILEVGPGEGALTKYILRYHPKSQITLIEPDKFFYKRLKRMFGNLGNVKIINKTFEEFHTNTRYSLIILNYVIQHLDLNSIEKLLPLLGRDGVLLLTFTQPTFFTLLHKTIYQKLTKSPINLYNFNTIKRKIEETGMKLEVSIPLSLWEKSFILVFKSP